MSIDGYIHEQVQIAARPVAGSWYLNGTLQKRARADMKQVLVRIRLSRRSYQRVVLRPRHG